MTSHVILTRGQDEPGWASIPMRSWLMHLPEGTYLGELQVPRESLPESAGTLATALRETGWAAAGTLELVEDDTWRVDVVPG